MQGEAEAEGETLIQGSEQLVTLSLKQPSTGFYCGTLSLRLFFYARLAQKLDLLVITLYLIFLKRKKKRQGQVQVNYLEKYPIPNFGICSTFISGHDKQVFV